ncbi:class I adenylate-forming enzyme family protein [Lentzea sp. NPDC004782]|uniref:class I adenylate-forming enzyme family protein n=1 Tax=Lentzea sp. NPDC004782 TaxID=3154458 RepID=UPI0033B2909C
MLLAEVPDTVVVATSGSTGAPAKWSRSRDQLLTEVGLLAALWRCSRVDLIFAFAPPTHLYGVLTTLLLPAVLGVPVWYHPGVDAPATDVSGKGVGVTAIPWTFRILRRHRAVYATAVEIAIMHSTANLPPGAAETATGLGGEHVRITEVFGSTESGGIAHRVERDGVWTLFEDVRLNGPVGEETRLVVAGPRLAQGLTTWDTRDFVEVVDERRFRFRGKRVRLRKINGVRVDLDVVEQRLREVVPVEDLACVPVDDEVRGESFAVLVVPFEPDGTLPTAIRVALKEFGLSPQEERMVDRIDRSETGKLRG